MQKTRRNTGFLHFLYIREEIKVNWISIKDKLPSDGQLVQTKIDDKNETRNETQLIYKDGLWWFSNMLMYVYYRPTHWREIEKRSCEDSVHR